MEINYNLTGKDVLEFEKKRLGRNIFFKNYIFIIAIPLAFIFREIIGPSHYSISQGAVKTTYETNYWIDILLDYCYLFLIVILVRYRNIYFLKKIIKNNPLLIGSRKLEVIENKIIFHSKNSKSEHVFSDFQKFEESKNFYFLFLSKDMGFVIPKQQVAHKGFFESLKEQIPN